MEVNGIRLGLEIFGDPRGSPVVWCHGGLSSRLDAALALDAAAAGARLVSIDRPGIGLSDPVHDWSVAAFPELVAGVMDQLRHDQFSVVGWSAGGPYALACAHLLPGRVRSAATVAGMYPVTDPARRRELGLMLDRVLLRSASRAPRTTRTLVALLSSLPDVATRAALARTMTDAERMAWRGGSSSEMVAFVREATGQGGHGIVADYAALTSHWGFELVDVVTPVVVWHGERDPLVPLSHAHRLAAELGSANLETRPGGGHFLPLTDAGAILTRLLSDGGDRAATP